MTIKWCRHVILIATDMRWHRFGLCMTCGLSPFEFHCFYLNIQRVRMFEDRPQIKCTPNSRRVRKLIPWYHLANRPTGNVFFSCYLSLCCLFSEFFLAPKTESQGLFHYEDKITKAGSRMPLILGFIKPETPCIPEDNGGFLPWQFNEFLFNPFLCRLWSLAWVASFEQSDCVFHLLGAKKETFSKVPCFWAALLFVPSSPHQNREILKYRGGGLDRYFEIHQEPPEFPTPRGIFGWMACAFPPVCVPSENGCTLPKVSVCPPSVVSLFFSHFSRFQPLFCALSYFIPDQVLINFFSQCVLCSVWFKLAAVALNFLPKLWFPLSGFLFILCSFDPSIIQPHSSTSNHQHANEQYTDLPPNCSMHQLTPGSSSNIPRHLNSDDHASLFERIARQLCTTYLSTPLHHLVLHQAKVTPDVGCSSRSALCVGCVHIILHCLLFPSDFTLIVFSPLDTCYICFICDYTWLGLFY